MPVSLPEGEVGVSVSFRTISLPFEAIRAEYLSRTQWLRKGRPSCPFCTRYKVAPWPKTYDRYIYIYIYIYIYRRTRCTILVHVGLAQARPNKMANSNPLVKWPPLSHYVIPTIDDW